MFVESTKTPPPASSTMAKSYWVSRDAMTGLAHDMYSRTFNGEPGSIGGLRESATSNEPMYLGTSR